MKHNFGWKWKQTHFVLLTFSNSMQCSKYESEFYHVSRPIDVLFGGVRWVEFSSQSRLAELGSNKPSARIHLGERWKKMLRCCAAPCSQSPLSVDAWWSRTFCTILDVCGCFILLQMGGGEVMRAGRELDQRVGE